MSGWRPKRFWKEAAIAEVPGGYEVRLDGRPTRTPAKQPLVLPTAALARGIAAEWDAQDREVAPETMPLTRSANSAIDKVAPQQAEVARLLAAYGGSDLLCYRAASPPELVARQAAGWDPLLIWAEETLAAPLAVTQGVMPVPQPTASLAVLNGAVETLDPFALAGFHDLVALSGSLILALAVMRGRLTAEEAWALSRIDEIWQEEQWGRDEEAAELAAYRYRGFVDAARFLQLLRDG